MARRPAMFRGVSPEVLLRQVANTAAWALEGPSDTPATRWRAALRDGASVPWEGSRNAAARGGLREAYLEVLLAAHFATVATYVPTDVDSHVRYHAWERAQRASDLEVLVRTLDGVDAWDARDVSARVVTVEGVGNVSGHDGEWLGIRAGALGRALTLGADALADAIAARIDAELDREALAMHTVTEARRELDALRLATTLAHNVGDLSRVVDEWVAHTPRSLALRTRYHALGHAEGPGDPSAQRWGGAFALAGHINKHAGMSAENHRFIPLRAARGLRSDRALLLPIGPFFDTWGETIARHPSMRAAPDALAQTVTALVEGHLFDTTQQGYLRALAGIHRAHRGGLNALAPDVPARLRRTLAAGPVREATGLDPARFEARMVNRYRAARTAWR